MAQANRAAARRPHAKADASKTGAELRSASPADLDGAAESPATLLRQRLEDAYANSPERWSARKTLLFIVVTCGSFWAAVGAILVSLHR